MTKRGEEKNQPRKRTTAKLVQVTENLSPPPLIVPQPEPDDQGWGKDGLTLKQRQFVKAYVGPAAGNATRAAEMAGYNANNNNSLRATASENLTKPNVQRAIARALARREGGKEWTRAGIVEIARSSMADFVTVGDDGNPKFDFSRAFAAGAIGTLKKIRIRPTDLGPDVTFEGYSRMEALSLLAKVNGLVNDKQDPAVSVSVHHMSQDDLVRIATRGSPGTAPAGPGAGVTDRLR